MQGSCRSRQTGRWSGQHNRSVDRGEARLTFRNAFRAVLATALILVILPAPELQAAAAAVIHIRVLEGDGAVHSAGTRSSRTLSVEITDETGKPVDGAAVSFRLPEEGPGGTFADKIRTNIAITGPDGKAGLREFNAGTLTGPFQIRVTALKEGVRAGTIVDQFVSEIPKSRVRTPSTARSLVEGNRPAGSRKWILWLAAAAGAAAAGILASTASKTANPGAPAPTPTVIPPPTVGPPSISIGRPQ